MVDMGYVAEELAPLSKLQLVYPSKISQESVLRLYLAAHADSCPQLAHLHEFGFDLELARTFLSAFAGSRIEVPSRKALARTWDDLRFWLHVQKRIELGDEELDESMRKVAKALGVTKRRDAEAHQRFQRLRKQLHL